MSVEPEIREFLTSRRARVTPERAALPTYGGRRRRVSGLRREEVALLAGISVEYYTRLERGNADRALSELIGQLSTRSEDFRVRWARHDVQFHRTGGKQFHHPLVGDLTLAFEMLQLSADPGLSLLSYSAEPGSVSEQRLGELARWGATRTRLSAVEAETQRDTVRDS